MIRLGPKPRLGQSSQVGMRKRKNSGSSRSHAFGGQWTTAKLAVLAEYLSRYTTALKAQPFEKYYIDALAGTGYRDARRRPGTPDTIGPLFPDLAESEPQELLDGSARQALRVIPTFDRYVFIERSRTRCAQLEGLKAEFPELAKAMSVREGDANAVLQELCNGNWKNRRAVVFLDPYGMQVEWTTIEVIAPQSCVSPVQGRSTCGFSSPWAWASIDS